MARNPTEPCPGPIGATPLRTAPRAQGGGTAPAAIRGRSDRDELDQFIYIITHDLRASIRALKEVPTWIEEDLGPQIDSLPGEARDHLRFIVRHAERLDRFMVDLLSYSRVGRLQTPARVRLDEVLDAVCPRGARVEARFAVPEIRIGPEDARRLLGPLLQNALTHHPGASPRIRTGSRPVEDGVLIWVEDDGPGIPEGQREQALALMTTLRPRDEVEGSGMGLPIAAKVARCYGGTLRLTEAGDGTGCRVEVRLPGNCCPD